MIDGSMRLSLTHNMLGQLFSLKRKIGQKVRSAESANVGGIGKYWNQKNGSLA